MMAAITRASVLVLCLVGCGDRRDRPRDPAPATERGVTPPRTAPGASGPGAVVHPAPALGDRPAGASPPRPEDPGGARPAGTGEEILTTLHRTNQLQLEAARLGQHKAQSPAVRQLAGRLRRDHQEAARQIAARARAQGLDLTGAGPSPEEKRQALVSLRELRGPAFDRHFVTVVADEHARLLQTLEAVQADGPELPEELRKLLADDLIPALEQHHRQALELQAGEGSPSRAAQGRRPPR